jgi:hypothetical protein
MCSPSCTKIRTVRRGAHGLCIRGKAVCGRPTARKDWALPLVNHQLDEQLTEVGWVGQLVAFCKERLA